jgi:hypothetical protein
LPQIFAGGELGHDPFGAGSVVVDVVGTRVAVVVGAAVVVVGAEVVGTEVVGAAVVVPSGACAVVVVVGVGAALEVFVGALLGVVVTPLLAIVKFARRLDLLPSDQVSRTLMLWEPSGEVRGVVRERRTVGIRAHEIKGWVHFGSNGWLRAPRTVQVEVNLVQAPRVPHKDIDLALNRRAVEPRRVGPIGIQAHDEP